MDSNRWNTILDLVRRALALASADRDAFLRVNAGDAQIHAAVRQLIEAHEEVRAGFASGLPDPQDVSTLGLTYEGTPPDDPGSIGPYTIIRTLGWGGMGVVYLAQQTEPIKRQVALKLIRYRSDSPRALLRFEQERQALALMSHPNIAQVYDAGTTAAGQPYFAMEYVDGESITAYCERRRLSMSERLELFAQVCRGIHHAHQKGVVHRDIKPSNVLVSGPHGDIHVKIIDFGVAKATEASDLLREAYTETGALVGTPSYMSPEQASGGSIDVDIRSDVYSLGVLLYELLVGVPPFDRQMLREAGYAEILRQIREVDPPKPSERLREMRDRGDAAKRREISMPSLQQDLQRDLDWVVLRALEKDRERRYDSASALAEDIERFRRCESVQATPPSVRYQVFKFVRRHKIQSAAVALAALFYLFGLGIMGVIGIRASMSIDEYREKLSAAEDRIEKLISQPHGESR